MRALKIILILAFALAALIGLLGSIGGDRMRVERSIVINAPVEEVWEHVATLAAQDRWSPWNEQDPAMKKTYQGADGTVGAMQRWEGNDAVGKGELRITAVEPLRAVRMRLAFVEPFQSESEVAIELAPEGEGTRATWTKDDDMGFGDRLMNKFIDIAGMVAKDYDKGLALLKQQAEAAWAAKPKFEIRTMDWPGALYVGTREVVALADLKAAFEKGFGGAMAALNKAKAQPAGPPSGVYFAWDEERKTADLIAGIPALPDAVAKAKGLDTHEVPASRALVIDYSGGYSGLAAAHGALRARIRKDGLAQQLAIEEYITDPLAEPDSTKWLTRVIYLVQ